MTSPNRRRAALAFALVLPGCDGDPVATPVPPMDIHSYARPAEARVEHVALDLTPDFAAKRIDAVATLRIQRAAGAKTLVLDTDGLTIERVVAGDATLDWSLDDAEPNLGRALRITLPPSGDSVAIHYRTSPAASALQWLEPSQTDGGVKPYLFTQGQAILTRSWIPLQDTPGVRITYEATVHVDPALGIVPVMSASERRDRGEGTFHFVMDKPVPPYLIALAIGELERREISPRCAVWAEPGVVDAAATEFEDTEQMIVACEALYGPYRWGRYDVLVLPPSFPFGGMENPCLTFATPTILAGDKSLVALIAHELAHSWSGNLVTNATWSDFWLNEGFTVYLEQRIIEAIFGPERARMETLLGLKQLAAELRKLPRDDQQLHVDLRGRNPDDGMTSVPYDKGAAFLRRLEAGFGRTRFDAFLRDYFDAHAFQSITTQQFLDYLDEHLLASDPDAAAKIDLDEWIRGPGMPADNPVVTSAEFERVDHARATWLSQSGEPIDTRTWATTHWLHFLEGMPDDLAPEQLTELDDMFSFTQSENSEILAAWLELAIRRGYRPVDARVEQFLVRVGRRKFLKPLYLALMQADGGAARAKAIYGKARPGYHAVSRRTLDEIVGQ